MTQGADDVLAAARAGPRGRPDRPARGLAPRSAFVPLLETTDGAEGRRGRPSWSDLLSDPVLPRLVAACAATCRR